MKLIYTAIASLDAYVADEETRSSPAAGTARFRPGSRPLKLLDQRRFDDGVVYVRYALG